MSQLCRTADHLVIGGGLAGSMVAIRLAAAGSEVLLLEKERSSHHKVCGEFLSREAVEYLESAGVNPRALGAVTIRSVRLSSKRRRVEAVLPFVAFSLSRRVLDAAMIRRAAEIGCEVRSGTLVDSLDLQDGLWFAQTRNGESFQARTVFLANGKHDIHGWERGRGVQGNLVGFKQHWQLTTCQTEALRDYMELFLFPGGYGGLSLVEGDVANLCLVVQDTALRRIGGWPAQLAALLDDNPLLRQRLQSAKALWKRPLAISSIPYGYMAGNISTLWRVGDQAAVIPSFTGDGMSIALHSGALAAQMCLAGESAEDYHRRLQAQLGHGMSLAVQLSKGMVTGAGRTLAPLCFSLFPNAMGWIAASTRIPDSALLAMPVA